MQNLADPNSLITQITQQLQKLPTPLQRQVLDFVNFLAARQATPPGQSHLFCSE